MTPAEVLYVQSLLDNIEPGWVLTSTSATTGAPTEIRGERGAERFTLGLAFNSGDPAYIMRGGPARLVEHLHRIRPARRRS